MKKKILLILLYTIFFINSSVFYTYAQNTSNQPQNNSSQYEIDDKSKINLSAESAILMDAKTGFVLFDKNMNQKMYPASITKVLTALLILENGNLDDTLKASFNAIYNIGPGGSNMGLKENEEISLRDALYGIMLKSANEACMVASEHISGNTEKFVELMNKRAKEIGALNTHFANPHGYHDKNHYTTAYDMALIMKEAIKNKEFVKYISTKEHKIEKTNLSDERLLRNSNKLIQEDTSSFYKYCVGGKTGFTDQAGNTLVSYSKKDDMELICVVLKSKGKESYIDSIKLFEYGFNQFENKTIMEKTSFEKEVPVIQKFKEKNIDLGKCFVELKNNVSLKLPKELSLKDIDIKINLNEPLIAPLNVGNSVGKIDFKYKNEKIASEDIICKNDVKIIPEKKLKFKENLKKIAKFSIKSIQIILIIIIIISIIGYISRKFFKAKRRFKNNRRFR